MDIGDHVTTINLKVATVTPKEVIKVADMGVTTTIKEMKLKIAISVPHKYTYPLLPSLSLSLSLFLAQSI